MRSIIIVLFSILLITSCKEEKKVTKVEKTAVEKTETETKTETEITTQAVSKDQDQFLATTIAYFKNCKANAENRNDCRNSITQMISEFYKLDDFKDANGDYVVYDSIQPIIKRTETWTQLGKASDQKALAQAQQAANNGTATIAIDISESYGQVAMIVPGKLSKSVSWEREVPNTAALVNYSADKSFMNQPLSYAFKSPENIVLFSKK